MIKLLGRALAGLLTLAIRALELALLLAAAGTAARPRGKGGHAFRVDINFAR